MPVAGLEPAVLPRRAQGDDRAKPGHDDRVSRSLGDALARLWQTIEARRGASPDGSYTAKLLADGPAGVARKLGEEALETVIEAVQGDTAALTRESADVLYHLLVLWAAAGLSPDDVAAELARREGTSGIAEKRGRK
jgi:phosphoribosyl-ATP pyrophosphohydrolase